MVWVIIEGSCKPNKAHSTVKIGNFVENLISRKHGGIYTFLIPRNGQHETGLHHQD